MESAKNERLIILREFTSGVKALLPILLGVIPFGLTTGIAVTQTHITPQDGFIMSILVYSGAALLVALQLIQANTPVVVTIISALMVNLRFLMYSISLSPYLKHLPQRWRALLAYLLSDQAYAVSISNFENHTVPQRGHWHFLGAALTMWVAWQGSLLIGMVVGISLPKDWSLDFTIPLTFLALAVPNIRDKATGTAALSAGVMTVLLNNMPYKTGTVIAAIVGIGLGVLVERSNSI
ncbi:hypothetical protein SE15_06470 [Thermanaerothrix daxensis]|uniref:Branched-chain amino acid ABC transporter permease n=1 Tax=Thermanaerothrix daxensis TaxID=869279 RepID=A0A0P6XWR3_9CHLR|nr:AzlC family ABC transporter permease [Thermanaerothrix daxensis]KPL84679.1 hypothetical protein SE15_06470 [Thermanaerothrix daxensis]